MMLGEGYVTLNFGKNGAAVSKLDNELTKKFGSGYYMDLFLWKKYQERDYDVTILSLGTNDALKGFFSEEGYEQSFRNDYKTLLDVISNHSKHVIVCIPPKSEEGDYETLNNRVPDLIKEIAKDFCIHDFGSLMSEDGLVSKKLFMEDTVHPNPSGYTVMA